MAANCSDNDISSSEGRYRVPNQVNYDTHENPDEVNSERESGEIVSSEAGNSFEEPAALPPSGRGKKRQKKTKKRSPIKRKKKKRSPSSSSSDSSSSSSQSSSSDDSDSDSHPRRHKRFKIVAKGDENMWELPKSMARYANSQFREYIPDKSIEETLLSGYPVPANIQKVKRLDDFLKTLISPSTSCMDTVLEKTQGRIRQVMGPLSKLWKELEDITKNKEPVEVPVDKFKTMVEQTVLLVGQASTSVSYNRRLNVLRGLYKDPRKAKSLLKDKASLLNDEDESLFGKKFRAHIVETEKSRKQTIEVFSNNNNAMKLSTRKPFRKGPSQRPNGGGRHFFRGNRDYNNNKNGGGQQRYQQPAKRQWKGSNGAASNGKFLFHPKKRGTLLQRVPRSDSNDRSKTCSPNGEKFVYKRFSKGSSGREIVPFQPSLGETHPRQKHLNNKRLQNPISGHSISVKSARTNSHVKGTGKSSRKRNNRNVGEGSHPQSKKYSGSVLEQPISGQEKRRRKSSCNKFKEIKQVCSLRAFQNGRLVLPALPTGAGRFPLFYLLQ